MSGTASGSERLATEQSSHRRDQPTVIVGSVVNTLAVSAGMRHAGLWGISAVAPKGRSSQVSKTSGLAKATTASTAGVLALVGAGFVVTAFISPTPSPPEPNLDAREVVKSEPNLDSREFVKSTSPAPPQRSRVQPSPPAKTQGGGIDDRISGLVLPESEPVEIAIPRLGVESGLVDLGVDAAGAMEVPQDPAVAGWYRLGPAPGALGPAVIAGHVTWDRLPAVFFRISTLRHGDRVSVIRKDGKMAIFAVDRVEKYAKTRFPTQAVYGGIDHAGLRLITCGGKYDDFTHRYFDNVVVFATLIAVRSIKG